MKPAARGKLASKPPQAALYSKPKGTSYGRPKATGKLGAKPNPLRSKIQDLRTQLGNTPQNLPPVPTSNPLPWDGGYETSVGNLRREHDLNASQLQQQELATKQDYGFDDTSNPFSRAALLQQSYNQNRAKTLNTYAARGQLYSGSTSNAQAYDLNNYNQSYDTTRRQYAGALSDLAFKRQQNENALTGGIASAEADRLQNALQQAPDPSEAPPDVANPAYGDLSARLNALTAKKKRKRK